MFGLAIVDIIAILLYFAVVLYIGYRAMKKIKNQEDYFLGGRNFGRWIQTFAAFGQGTSAESAVTATTMVASNGAGGIGAMMATGLLGMPFFWMTTMWYRRLRLLTLADFFEERYQSKAMAGFYACCQAIFFVLVAAMGFAAMSKTVAAIAVKPDAVLTQVQLDERARAYELSELESRDFELLSNVEKERMGQLRLEKPRRIFSYINRNWLMIGIAVIVLLYAVSGGLEAAFVTDMIQGIFIIILTIILIPFAMMRINEIFGTSGILGPFEALHQQLPTSFFDILGSPNMAEFTWYWIIAFSIMGMLNTAIQANQLTAAGSAKDDETARIGFLRGIFIKRYCTVIWGFVAMMTLLLYGKSVTDPDFIWGHATRDLLGPLNLGLVGLMIACLMAALMSTADALMITTSALLTHSVYRPIVPGKSEHHYVQVGRIFCLVYIIGGILIAIKFDSVWGLFKFMLMFNCIVAAAFWLGMIWRRANKPAAWTSMIVTFVMTLLIPFFAPLIPGIRSSEYLGKMTDSYVVSNTYAARQADVDERNDQLTRWERLEAIGKAEGQKPESLMLGQSFTKSYSMPQRSIFWMQGVERDEQGKPVGKGILKAELVMLDLLGWDLSQNSYSFNEMMTAVFRVVIPFGILILVALFTRPQEKYHLDRFYGKMRTAVNSDHALDAEEMELTNQNPARFDHLKLFPNSSWEFRKWNRRDWIGHAWVIVGISGIILLIYMIVSLGA